jgi:hypothetical protein
MMNTERRAEIVRILEESRQAFELAAHAFPAQSVTWSSTPECWSALQIAEHVAITEHGMFRMLGAATPTESSSENPKREASLARMVLDRNRQAPAPQHVHPTGRFDSMAEAIRQFSEERTRTVRFAEETELDLFGLTAPHPILGAVNGYELLIIMAGHSRRHVAQLEEIRQRLEQGTAPRE